ncbi:Trm112 family protein [Vibrio sp. SS-MA-C1-2]|uniref:Trm112 family protein n=1 Tax=Vibrio sp. SS-MA-C1-2 TaxID=2908646 RepID=UPI001F4764E5|nr:Trm112 family protein [Vibrio sp. SS-MA-C1-2]UJF17387.1 Trm112 family protein [Vibrio sp. SS-MA-C1-2]
MDHRLLEVIACPVCKGKLNYNKENNELVCKFDRIAFPIKEGIPVMIEQEARHMSVDEVI